MSIVSDVRAGVAVVRTTAASIAIACAFVLGIGLTEAYEHNFSLRFGFVRIEGMGPRLKAAGEDQAKAVKVVQTDLDSCHLSYASAQSALHDTQTAVKALEAESAKREGEAAKAHQAGQEAIAAAGRTATAIMALKPDGDVCRAAHKLATGG